jgi:hypothetical protein
MKREEALPPWPNQIVTWLLAPWFIVAPLAVLSQHVLPLIPGRFSESTAVLIETTALCVSNFAVAAGLLILLITLWTVVTQRTLDAFRKLLFMSVAVLGVSPAITSLAVTSMLVARAQPIVFAFAGACGVVLAAVGASVTLSKSHTRAAGLALCGIALTEVLRLVAWFTLTEASDAGNPSLYTRGVMMVNLSLVAEALVLTVACLWLWVRGGRFGRLAVNTAIGVALAIALLSHGDSGLSALIRTCLVDPVPGGLPATWTRFAQFLTCASALAGGAFLLHGARGSRVSSCIGVLLLARGATDVPLRFVFVAGACSLLLDAAVSPKGMWDELLAARPKTTSA